MTYLCIATELLENNKLKLRSLSGDFSHIIDNGANGIRIGDLANIKMNGERVRSCRRTTCDEENYGFDIIVDNNRVLVDNVIGRPDKMKNCYYYGTELFGRVKRLDEPTDDQEKRLQLRLLTEDEATADYSQYVWGGRQYLSYGSGERSEGSSGPTVPTRSTSLGLEQGKTKNEKDKSSSSRAAPLPAPRLSLEKKSPSSAPSSEMPMAHQNSPNGNIHQNQPRGSIQQNPPIQNNQQNPSNHYIIGLVVAQRSDEFCVWTRETNSLIRCGGLRNHPEVRIGSWLSMKIPSESVLTVKSGKLHSNDYKLNPVQLLQAVPTANNDNVLVSYTDIIGNPNCNLLAHPILGTIYSDEILDIGTHVITVTYVPHQQMFWKVVKSEKVEEPEHHQKVQQYRAMKQHEPMLRPVHLPNGNNHQNQQRGSIPQNPPDRDFHQHPQNRSIHQNPPNVNIHQNQHRGSIPKNPPNGNSHQYPRSRSIHQNPPNVNFHQNEQRGTIQQNPAMAQYPPLAEPVLHQNPLNGNNHRNQQRGNIQQNPPNKNSHQYSRNGKNQQNQQKESIQQNPPIGNSHENAPTRNNNKNQPKRNQQYVQGEAVVTGKYTNDNNQKIVLCLWMITEHKQVKYYGSLAETQHISVGDSVTILYFKNKENIRYEYNSLKKLPENRFTTTVVNGYVHFMITVFDNILKQDGCPYDTTEHEHFGKILQRRTQLPLNCSYGCEIVISTADKYCDHKHVSNWDIYRVISNPRRDLIITFEDVIKIDIVRKQMEADAGQRDAFDKVNRFYLH